MGEEVDVEMVGEACAEGGKDGGVTDGELMVQGQVYRKVETQGT